MKTNTIPLAMTGTPPRQGSSRRITQYFVFDPYGFYRLFDTWQEAMTFLDIKKHEFYFALNKGTPVGSRFIDIYIPADERNRIRQTELIRLTNPQTPKEGTTP